MSVRDVTSCNGVLPISIGPGLSILGNRPVPVARKSAHDSEHQTPIWRLDERQPSLVRKREAVNVIKAAKQQGATKVEFCWGNAKAVVHLKDDQKNIAPEEQITL